MRSELEVKTDWINLNHDLRNVKYLLKTRPQDEKLTDLEGKLEKRLKKVEAEKAGLKVVGDGR
jgi:hypothetical protein